MKKTIALCILSALLFTGCARMPVQPEPAAPEVVDPTVTGTIPEAAPETVPAAPESTVTEEEAKALAIAKVPGAALTDIREFKPDRDDGRMEYEGSIVYDNMEYEFEIDAATGEFLSWEAESVFD